MRILYHRKRGLALFMALMMSLTIFPAAHAIAANVGDVIYSEGFETGNTLQKNGDATVTLATDYAAIGTNSLSVAPTAENNYSGAALRNDSLGTPMLPGGEYKLTAKVFGVKDATLGVRVETTDSGGGNTYGSVGSAKATLVAGKWADVTMEFTVPEDHQSVNAIVFHNDDKIPDFIFYLDEVKLQITALPAAKQETAGLLAYSEGFESGNTLDKNGDATIAITTDYAAAGSSSLSVAPTGANNYSGVALRNESLDMPMLPGGKYKLTAKALSAKDAKLGVRVETKDSSGGDTYGNVGSATVTLTAGEWVDVVMEFTVPAEHQSVTAIVFHNDAKLYDFTFYLDEVKLETMALPKEAEPEITEVLRFTFDNKATQEGLFSAADISSQIEWLNEAGAGKDSNTALKVTHVDGTSYTSADNAVRLTFSEPLPVGGIYNISVWFYAPAAGNEGKGTLTGPGVVINREYGNSQYKLPSDFGTLPIGQWKEVNVNTPLLDLPLKTIDFRLVVNDKEKHADVWYIDNIVISRVGELKTVTVPTWDLTLPSLAETYKDYFLIGNILEPGQTEDAETTAMFKHHYNMVTAENAMKPEKLSPEKGVYDFSKADMLVNWAAENNIKVHGHTLLWHKQSAAWLTNDEKGNVLTRAEAKANMEDYISNVAGHFKGRVMSWEVVNEAFTGGSGIPTDWKTMLREGGDTLEDSPWFAAYENGADKSKGESGADYIYDAFVFARLADPYATLYYNDFNEDDAPRREAMALLAEDLNEKWKTDERNTDPDRLLVEGMLLQAHYWMDNLDVSSVEATFARFVKAGVKISVAELDIPFGSYANQRPSGVPLTKEEELLQAQRYAQLFEVYKKYASSIERITFWGKADPQSWRSQGNPLIFDKVFAPKPSYYAVINPNAYLFPDWKNSYSDVTIGDWFYADVASADINKLMGGTGASTFSPEMQVTWGQLLTILYRLDGQTGVAADELWNATAGNWAVDKGFAEAGFRYDQPLSRQDLAIIINKYLTYSGQTLPLRVCAGQHTYADDAMIDAQAKPAEELLYDTGIMTGKPGNRFDPLGYINRAEMASILHRFSEAIKAAEAN